jgi:hypothetical protein
MGDEVIAAAGHGRVNRTTAGSWEVPMLDLSDANSSRLRGVPLGPRYIHQCGRNIPSTVVIPAIIEPAIAIAAGEAGRQLAVK